MYLSAGCIFNYNKVFRTILKNLNFLYIYILCVKAVDEKNCYLLNFIYNWNLCIYKNKRRFFYLEVKIATEKFQIPL